MAKVAQQSRMPPLKPPNIISFDETNIPAIPNINVSSISGLGLSQTLAQVQAQAQAQAQATAQQQQSALRAQGQAAGLQQVYNQAAFLRPQSTVPLSQANMPPATAATSVATSSAATTGFQIQNLVEM